MPVPVSLPDNLIAEINAVTDDHVAFITKAVRRLLHEGGPSALERKSRLASPGMTLKSPRFREGRRVTSQG